METGLASDASAAVVASMIAAAMVHRIAYLSDKRGLVGKGLASWRHSIRATDAVGQLCHRGKSGPRKLFRAPLY